MFSIKLYGLMAGMKNIIIVIINTAKSPYGKSALRRNFSFGEKSDDENSLDEIP